MATLGQLRLLDEMVDGLRKTLCEELLERIPSHWDGMQLRRLMADIARERYGHDMRPAEVRRYNFARVKNNLY